MQQAEAMILYGDIQNMLRAWGSCRAIADSSHVDYPSATAFAPVIMTTEKKRRRILELPEPVMDTIDSAISSLRRRCQRSKGDQRYNVLCLYYCNEDRGTLSEKTIARVLRTSRDRVRTARIGAENWVESRIAMGLDSANSEG